MGNAARKAIHHITIIPRCDVAPRDCHSNRKDTVEWHNTLDKAVTIKFWDESLFGVNSLLVEAGERETLDILESAPTGNHEYDVSCGPGMPGPRIIVNPPNGD